LFCIARWGYHRSMVICVVLHRTLGISPQHGHLRRLPFCIARWGYHRSMVICMVIGKNLNREVVCYSLEQLLLLPLPDMLGDGHRQHRLYRNRVCIVRWGYHRSMVIRLLSLGCAALAPRTLCCWAKGFRVRSAHGSRPGVKLPPFGMAARPRRSPPALAQGQSRCACVMLCSLSRCACVMLCSLSLFLTLSY